MAKIVPICSSSKGNSTYVGDSNSGIIIDAGCSLKALREGLLVNNLSLDNVHGIFITHEHSDHIQALPMVTKHTDIPIFASEMVAEYLVSKGKVSSQENLYVTNSETTVINDFIVTSFPTPHDSVGSVGYTIQFDDKKISVCTDLGHITDTVRQNILASDLVLIEANYDEDLLKQNKLYPEHLKNRISSKNGHLSNSQSSDFISQLVDSGTTRIILGHLSQENNSPKSAFSSVKKKLDEINAEYNIDYILEVAPVKTQGKSIVV